MKTIRQNTFETNSSSTHSISITKKNKSKQLPLVDEDGYLLIKNLKSYTTSFGDYSDSSILECETKDKKSAIFVNWLIYTKTEVLFDSEEDENGEAYKNKLQILVDEVNKIVVEELSYKGVRITVDELLKSPWGDFSYHIEDDYYDFRFDLSNWEYDKDIKKIRKFIKDVVLDDTMVISDSDIAH